jgi:hypothetical protein
MSILSQLQRTRRDGVGAYLVIGPDFLEANVASGKGNWSQLLEEAGKLEKK